MGLRNEPTQLQKFFQNENIRHPGRDSNVLWRLVEHRELQVRHPNVFQKWFKPCLFRFFRNYLDMFCTFIPQLLFLACIFIYLVILIFYKWIAFNAGGTMMAVGYYPGSHCAPNLLVGLINMFMLKKRPEGFGGQTCFTNAYYPKQVRLKCDPYRVQSYTILHFRTWSKPFWCLSPYYAYRGCFS